MALATFLAGHPKVTRVLYPGLPDHPQHALAAAQMRGFGGMLAFDMGSIDAARRVVERVRIFALAESLGGVESLIGHPASMTHASVPPERRAALGLDRRPRPHLGGHRGHRRPHGGSGAGAATG